MSTEPTPSPSAADERVSVLVGDRLCVTCGFNLASQHVVREPHYRMLIVRCPECGTVASLQEFPLLGKWATRWGAILAALAFLLMIAFAIVTAGAIAGASTGIARAMAKPCAQAIIKAHIAWATAQHEAETAKALAAQEASRAATLESQRMAHETIRTLTQAQLDGQTLTNEQLQALTAAAQALTQATAATIPVPVQATSWPGMYGDQWVDESWWESQDKKEILSRATIRISPQVVRFTVLLAAIAFIFGVAWGVALLHARARQRLLVCTVLVAVATAIYVLSTGTTTSFTVGAGTTLRYVNELARSDMGPTPYIFSGVVAFVSLFLGMTLGRPIARLLVRLFLPPRLRGPLAALWIADGLPPPPIR